MKLIRKSFVLVLTFLTLNLYLPQVSFATKLKNPDGVRAYPVEIQTTPWVKLPGKKVQDDRSWLSRNKWWVLGGLAVVAGGAAAASGGESSDDDKKGCTGDECPSGINDVKVQW